MEHPNAGKKKLEEFRRKRAEQQAAAAAARSTLPTENAAPPAAPLPAGDSLGQQRGHGSNSAFPLPPAYDATVGSAPPHVPFYGAEAVAPLDPGQQGEDGALSHIQLLEDELRKEALAAARARASFLQEQQKSAALSAEVGRARSERDVWEKQRAELVEQVGRLREQLQKAEMELSQSGAQVAELQKVLEAAQIRCDAAVVAKEDAMAQLRVLRKQLAEAEEEQYRAEEDAAALRGEIRALRQSQEAAAASGHVEQLREVESERDTARAEVQETMLQLEVERQRLAAERQRTAAAQEEREGLVREAGRAAQEAQLLQWERDEMAAQLAASRLALEQLQSQLAASPQHGAQVASSGPQAAQSPPGPTAAGGPEVSDSPPDAANIDLRQGAAELGGAPAHDPAEPDAIPPQAVHTEGGSQPTLDPASTPESVSLQGELRALRSEAERRSEEVVRLAALVEKKEKGRIRLLAEVDEQSAEIERLFAENAGLAAGLREASAIASQWEAQLKDALQQNAELRAAMARLREESLARGGHASVGGAAGEAAAGAAQSGRAGGEDGAPTSGEADLQVQLARAHTRTEELEGQVAELSATYTEALRQLNRLRALYKPVLADIENRLGSLQTEHLKARQPMTPREVAQGS